MSLCSTWRRDPASLLESRNTFRVPFSTCHKLVAERESFNTSHSADSSYHYQPRGTCPRHRCHSDDARDDMLRSMWPHHARQESRGSGINGRRDECLQEVSSPGPPRADIAQPPAHHFHSSPPPPAPPAPRTAPPHPAPAPETMRTASPSSAPRRRTDVRFPSSPPPTSAPGRRTPPSGTRARPGGGGGRCGRTRRGEGHSA